MEGRAADSYVDTRRCAGLSRRSEHERAIRPKTRTSTQTSSEGGEMNIRNQLVCAWSAIGFAVICLAGFLFADLPIPPISPNLSAEEVAAIYSENTLSMRLWDFADYEQCRVYLFVRCGAVHADETYRRRSRPRIYVHATWRWLCHYAGVCVFGRVLDGGGIPA